MTPLAAWRRLLAISAACETALIWPKLASRWLAPFTLTLWRGLVALAALAVFLPARSTRPELRARDALFLGTTNGWLSSATMAFRDRADRHRASRPRHRRMPLIPTGLADLRCRESA